MDLSGLLGGLLLDPAFARAARADGPHGSVVTPDAAIPFLAAGMARHRLVLAVTATTRQAEDLAAAASSLTGTARVAVLPAWETLPHERLSPSSDTVGRRLAVLRRLAHPDPDDETIGAAGPRRGPDPGPAAADRPGAGRPAARGGAPGRRDRPRGARRGAGHDRLRRHRPGREARPVRRSAAGSSTSSRPPRSTPCGWSSGATTSRRSATSASPTSARWRSPGTGCGRRPAGSCCSPRRCGRARPPWPGGTPSSPRCAPSWPRGSPSRAWRRSPPSWPTAWRAWSTPWPAAGPATRRRWSCSATPSWSAPRPTTSWPRATSSSPRPGTTPRSATRPRSTSVPRPTGPSRRCARPPTASGSPGGPPARSAWRQPVRSPPTSSSDPDDRDVDPLAIDPDAIALAITATPAYRGDGKALVTDLQAALSAGRRVVAVTAGVGSAQRLAEQLGAAGCASAGRAGDHPLATWRRRGHRHDRAARPRPGRSRCRAAGRHRDRHPRPEGLHPGHGPDALAPAQHRRPAAAGRRRLRRPRAARGRALRRDDPADRRRGDPRVPGPGVRAEQARPAAGPPLRADRPARPGHPLRRWRGAQRPPARRCGLAADQDPRAQGSPPDRR